MAESSERALTSGEASYIAAARDKAFVLYEGVRTPCGAIRAGEQVLGELLGDPDPIGAVTPALRAAVIWYQGTWRDRLVPHEPDIVCDNLVRRHGELAGPARKAFCTSLAAEVAALTAEALCRFASSRPVIIALEDP